MLSGVPVLLAKVRQYKPRVVCFVGKQIGEVFCKEAGRLESVHTLAGPDKTGVDGDGAMQLMKKEKAKTKTKAGKKKAFEWGMQDFKVVHPDVGLESRMYTLSHFHSLVSNPDTSVA
jgi:thymine-DNA glycosylase